MPKSGFTGFLTRACGQGGMNIDADRRHPKWRAKSIVTGRLGPAKRQTENGLHRLEAAADLEHCFHFD